MFIHAHLKGKFMAYKMILWQKVVWNPIIVQYQIYTRVTGISDTSAHMKTHNENGPFLNDTGDIMHSGMKLLK